jgi:phage-related minor tail protein
MIFVFVGANAANNPFDLSVNLKKIDQDQDALLSELKAMTEAKEEREEQEEQKINKAEEAAIEVDETAAKRESRTGKSSSRKT